MQSRHTLRRSWVRIVRAACERGPARHRSRILSDSPRNAIYDAMASLCRRIGGPRAGPFCTRSGDTFGALCDRQATSSQIPEPSKAHPAQIGWRCVESCWAVASAYPQYSPSCCKSVDLQRGRSQRPPERMPAQRTVHAALGRTPGGHHAFGDYRERSCRH